MKKIFSLLLAVMLLVSGMSLAAFADTSAGYSVTVSDSTAEIGDTVTVSVALNECVDVWNVYFELVLPAGLKYVSSSVNGNFDDETGMDGLGFNDSAMVCSALGALAAGYTGGAVNMLTVTCEVVGAGDLTVSLNNAAIYNENGSSVGAGVSSASISVAAPHEHNYTGEYKYDENGHWQLCECGEAGEVEAHDMVEGVCSVCGYEEEIVVTPEPSEKPADPTPKPTAKPSTGTDKSPQTGDDSAILLWAGMLTICAAAVAVLVAAKKSKASK